MQTATTPTTTETIAKIRLHIEKLVAERYARVLRAENYVVRHVENKMPIALVDTKESLVGFRFAPSTIGATRWTEQGAKNTAAGINNAYPEYNVEAIPYLDAVDDEIVNGHKCIEWLEQLQ